MEEGGSDVVNIQLGDKGDYPILTEATPGYLFFLEEPELGLHASLQRSLVQVLKNSHRTMRHQFFLTTHFHHMLDLLEDDALVSIFSFSKIEAPSSATNQADREPGQNEGGVVPVQWTGRQAGVASSRGKKPSNAWMSRPLSLSQAITSWAAASMIARQA